MLSRTRLLLLIIFAYAGVLNLFVAHLFMQRHPDVVRSVRRRSAQVVSGLLYDRPPRNALNRSGLDPPWYGSRLTLPIARPAATASFAASCPPGLPTVVVAVAPPGRRSATPDVRMLTALRDMLRSFQLRVVLLGSAAALTPTHRLWCSSGPLQCAVAELPPSVAVSADPADAGVLSLLTEPLLVLTPCLDDIVLLHSALFLPALFMRQLQRLTRPGKVTCLAVLRAQSRAAPAPTSFGPFANCPALAFRLPRSFLLSTRGAPGDTAALAAQRGLLAPAAGLLKI